YRYLKYRAALSTSSGATTPAVNDVTLCFSDVLRVTSLSVATANGVFGGTVDLSATLSGSVGALGGRSVAFSFNGSSAGAATTDSSGVARIAGVSLAGISAGTYPDDVGAAYAGERGYNSSTGLAALVVVRADQTISFGALAGHTWGDADFTVSASASSGLTVAFSASGNCTVSGGTVHITGAGSCTISASQAGNNNYKPALA